MGYVRFCTETPVIVGGLLFISRSSARSTLGGVIEHEACTVPERSVVVLSFHYLPIETAIYKESRRRVLKFRADL